MLRRLKIQLRFLKKPPEPGSLEELIMLSLESWEEYRFHEYMVGVMHAVAYASRGKDGFEPIDKVASSLREKYFTVKTVKLDEKEKEEFLNLAENYAIKIDVSKVMGEMDPPVPSGKKFHYTRKPRGEFVD